MSKIKNLFLVGCIALLAACSGVPDGIEPVENFDANSYLGTWYEVARLNHPFEAGLSNVTATYSFNADGSIKVINRGLDEEGSFDDIEGRATFAGAEDIGHLKVSFFGPFAASYVVFELGESYDYAFVTGFNKEYLWLLSRTPTVSDELKNSFLSLAAEKGYKTDELIFVDQSFYTQPEG